MGGMQVALRLKIVVGRNLKRKLKTRICTV